MSRKTYKALAENIKIDLANAETDQERDIIAAVIRESVAPVLKADNPQFRYDYFFEACGLNEWGTV